MPDLFCKHPFLSTFKICNDRACSRKSLSVGDIDEIQDIPLVEGSLARILFRFSDANEFHFSPPGLDCRMVSGD